MICSSGCWEHQADLLSNLTQITLEGFAPIEDLPFGRPREAVGVAHQQGLSRAVGAGDQQQLSLVNREIYPV